MGLLVTEPRDGADSAGAEDLLDETADFPGDAAPTGGILSFTVPAGGVPRLDSWLAAECPDLSRSRIQGLIEAGSVFVNGRAAVRRTEKTAPGDAVEIRLPPPVPAEPQPEDIPLAVVYEDESVLVVDKPAGLVVHPAPGHPGGTLVNAVLFHCPSLAGIGGVARPGIVHRLDRDTSGLMVVAKTQQAMASLAHNFQTHGAIGKTYLAVTHGAPPQLEGRIENLIGRSPRDRKKMAVVERNGKRAVTNWRVAGAGGAIACVECRIETGRTHQIRVHMASLGCPVIGDAAYGRPGRDKMLSPAPARQMLHAFRLEFPHPLGGRRMSFEAPPPPDFLPYLAACGIDPCSLNKG